MAVKVYNLTSTPGVYTPGLVRYILKAGFTRSKQRELLRASFPTLSDVGIANLWKGDYRVDFETESISVQG